MDSISQSAQTALDRNARKAGQRVDWQRTRISSPRGGMLGSCPFREATDAIVRNRLHENLDRAIDAEEQKQAEQFKYSKLRQRVLDAMSLVTRQLKSSSRKPDDYPRSIAFDAARDKDARQWLADLAVSVDVNQKSARPWFSALRSHVEQLPVNAPVSQMDPQILRGCLRGIL